MRLAAMISLVFLRGDGVADSNIVHGCWLILFEKRERLASGLTCPQRGPALPPQRMYRGGRARHSQAVV